jgi:hypothetical protein
MSDSDSDQPDEIDIRVEDEHVYTFTLTGDDGESEHRIEIPTTLLDEWGMSLTDEPPLVRAAVELLEKHHQSLPARFAVTDPAVAYEGFLDDLRLAINE